MNFENLVDFPIEVTQPVMHVYGEGLTPGCSIPCKALVPEGTIQFGAEKGTTAELWAGDDKVPSILAKLFNEKEWTTGEVQTGTCTIYDPENKTLFETKRVNKLTVKKAAIKKGGMIEFRFSVSFYNNPGDLDAVQSCMKLEDLMMKTEIEQDE